MYILHPGLSQRKEVSPGVADVYQKEYQFKYVKGVSCVTHLSCVKPVTKSPKCCLKSACRDQTSKLSESLAGSRFRSKSSSNPKRGLHPPLSDTAQTDKVTDRHKLLCQSSQEPLPVRGIASAY